MQIKLLITATVSDFSEDFWSVEDTACLQPEASSRNFQRNEFGYLRVKLEKNKGWKAIWGSDLMSYYRINYLLFTLNSSFSSSNCILFSLFPPFLIGKAVMSKLWEVKVFRHHKDPVVAYSICNAFISPSILPSALVLWSLSLLLYQHHSFNYPLPPQMCTYTYPKFCNSIQSITKPEKAGTTPLLEKTAQDVASETKSKVTIFWQLV